MYRCFFTIPVANTSLLKRKQRHVDTIIALRRIVYNVNIAGEGLRLLSLLSFVFSIPLWNTMLLKACVLQVSRFESDLHETAANHVIARCEQNRHQLQASVIRRMQVKWISTIKSTIRGTGSSRSRSNSRRTIWCFRHENKAENEKAIKRRRSEEVRTKNCAHRMNRIVCSDTMRNLQSHARNREGLEEEEGGVCEM
ncbi:uncharacterized protein G2W53_013020 [Senna tora]|uniref:Uncharacterized protein n=1 Tax=Senna tora TaxID=362788 RepID=A0A834TYJ1_9FABA|nr:uncharacterized protein G2W53_013020 [Senna tora]